MSRPRGDDPFGLHRVHPRRRTGTLSAPQPRARFEPAPPRSDDPPGEEGSAPDDGSGHSAGDGPVSLRVRGRDADRRADEPAEASQGPALERPHRRPGGRSADGAEQAGAAGVGESSDSRRGAQDGSSSEPGAGAGSSSPAGWLVGAWSHAEPEALDHLLSAAHEFLAAIRVIVDAADTVVEEQRRARGRGARRVRRIDVG